LSAEQLRRLPALLRRGPAAYGFRGDLWPRTRIAAVIRLEFGGSYHPTHVGRLCNQIRWSPPNPARRARQRNEAAITHWRKETLLAIKRGRKPGSKASSSESGFSPLPSVVRTYAQMGQTPVLRAWWTRDHLSAISALSPEGRLYFHCQERAFKSDDVVALFEHLLREVPNRLVIIWDGSPVRRSHTIREFLANGAAQRLHMEHLPAYAPELNPGKGLRPQLKGVGLRNVCCYDMPHLRSELCGAVKRVRRKPRILKGCFQGAGLLDLYARVNNHPPLQARKPWSIFERLRCGIVGDDFQAIGVFGRAPDGPLLRGVHRRALAFRGWWLEPTGLPADDDADLGSIARNGCLHALDIVVLIEEEVDDAVIPLFKAVEVSDVTIRKLHTQSFIC
jgi:transposase